MYTFSVDKRTVQVAITVGIAIFVVAVTSNGNSSYNATYVGPQFGMPSGPFQDPPCIASDISKNCNFCPPDQTPCCDTSTGESYCSCRFSSSANNYCPPLVAAFTLAAVNGDDGGVTSPLGAQNLRGGSNTITVNYPAGYTISGQPVEIQQEGGQFRITLTSATPTPAFTTVTHQQLWVFTPVRGITRDYLKGLTDEEIVGLLGNETVKRITQNYIRNGSDIGEEVYSLKEN